MADLFYDIQMHRKLKSKT